MAKKAAQPVKKSRSKAKKPVGTKPFTAVENPLGGWMYFDHAGRVTKGFKTEEQAQDAADEHEHIPNDPTLDRKKR